MRLIRIHKPFENDNIQIGTLSIDISNYKVSTQQNALTLTKKEFKILLLLARHKDTFVSKDYLASSVWNNNKIPTDNAISIQIARLRQKIASNLGVDCIETLWGVGYKLKVSNCIDK